jgi:uncharacterized protein DUF6295
MCTNITVRTDVEGSAKGPHGWIRVDTAHVSFDHPFHAALEHSLNVDFVNEGAGGLTRVAIELSAQSARALVENILVALAQGEAEAGGAPVTRSAERLASKGALT